jgi:two-component system response regulator YesN
MYKIIIVDDETYVREAIRDKIKWEQLGFEFAGGCENGSDAMEAVDKLKPDVVITDICMPFVDGLELTKYIQSKFPQIKVIILTGYDEFDYAQQALRMKVYDLIVKPITADELSSLLAKIKADLDEENRKFRDMNMLNTQIEESMPLLKERFLHRLVTGRLRKDRFEYNLAYFGINFKSDNFQVFIVDIDEYDVTGEKLSNTKDELLIYAVINICEEIVLKYEMGTVFQDDNERTIVIISESDAELLREKTMIVCEEIRQIIERYLWSTVTIGVGAVCSGLDGISESYTGSVAALSCRFIMGKNNIINVNAFVDNKNFTYDKELERSLISAIQTGTLQDAEKNILTIVKNLKKSNMTIENCYIYFQRIIVSMIDSLNEMGVEENQIFGNDVSPLTVVYKIETLDQVERWLDECCRKAIGIISEKKNSFVVKQVLKAEKYIKANYSDDKLSLNMICSYLVMSVSYFSMIFKNITGETFIEYLTSVRMEKAIELLKTTDLKSYEVADKTGYADPHYFGIIFKKYTGMTPTECREIKR